MQVEHAPVDVEVTQLLKSWSGGDQQALETLTPLLYSEMRRIAGALAFGERHDHTLQPTAVVHEAWIQLIGPRGVQSPELVWRSREHFLGVAARAMRRVLVDYARRRNRTKRGGGLRRAPLLEDTGSAPRTLGASAEGLLSLHLALERLERFAPLEARVVESRFFGGLTLEETAEFLGVSRRTVVRVWRRAKAWLGAELAGGHALES